MRRPDVFTLDYSHPLAHGLVFAGLGGLCGSAVFYDSSFIRGHGVLTQPVWEWAETGRPAISFRGASDLLKIPRISFWDIGNDPSAKFCLCFAYYDFGYISDNERMFANADTTASGQVDAQVIHATSSSDRWATGSSPSNGQYLDYSRPPVNKWYHGAWILDASGANTGVKRVFINGSEVVSAAYTSGKGPAWTADSFVTFGGRLSGSNSSGLFADVMLYRGRIPSPAEIALLADRTDPMLGGLIVEERPVLYFDMGGSTTHDLTATDLVTSSPSLGTPAVGQVHALTATGLTTSAPELTAPALGQVHGLTATALTVSAPVLGTPAVGQIHSLTAPALVVGSPVLGTPSLTENAPDVDALPAADLVVGSPVLGAPSIGQIHVLGSDGLVTGAPVLGSPSITQIHTLEALGLTVGVPVIGAPALNGSDIVLITAAEVARIVSATSRMKTVTASARVKQVRYEVTRA